MAEFKCINCGEIKESENPCSCPACGYRMFETPYDRRSKLVAEIEGFISCLEWKAVTRDDLVFEGKDEDDKRFPDYDRIVKYVTGKERTEDFLNNLLETREQLKLHFTTGFSKVYPVSFDHLNEILKQYDEVLCAAARILLPEAKVDLLPVEWEEVSLLYEETQNKYLWFSANELLDLIEKLAKKIAKFIKTNNLYGCNHKYHPSRCSDRFTVDTR